MVVPLQIYIIRIVRTFADDISLYETHSAYTSYMQAIRKALTIAAEHRAVPSAEQKFSRVCPGYEMCWRTKAPGEPDKEVKIQKVDFVSPPNVE